MILLFIALPTLFIQQIESGNVIFKAPKLISKETMYNLIFKNPNLNQKFPVDNFAFSFELLKTKYPQNILSVADVQSESYTGDDYYGFSIKKFIVNKDDIEVKFTFKKEAHGSWFRVRYASAKNDDEKTAFYDKNSTIGIMFERYIEMILPYTIVVQSGPEIGEVAPLDRPAMGNGLLPDKSGQLICNATNGLPDPKPEFINKRELSDSSVTPVSNDVTKIIWPVKVNDHGKIIQCRAGQDLMNITLNVYHYLTNVTTSPNIDGKVQPGSQIKCISKDGYPTARTYWVFVSGPQESSTHYELRDNNATLFINSSAPLNSNWTFECSAAFSIPHVVRKYLNYSSPSYPIKRAFSFSISGMDYLKDFLPKSSSMSPGIVLVFIILILIVIIISVFGVLKKEEIMKRINDIRSGLLNQSGQLSNDSEERKDTGSRGAKASSRLNGSEKGDTHKGSCEAVPLTSNLSPGSVESA